jgi:hypothetical protein
MKEVRENQQVNEPGYMRQKRRTFPVAAVVLITLCVLYAPSQLFNDVLSIGSARSQYGAHEKKVNQWSDVSLKHCERKVSNMAQDRTLQIVAFLQVLR